MRDNSATMLRAHKMPLISWLWRTETAREIAIGHNNVGRVQTLLIQTRIDSCASLSDGMFFVTRQGPLLCLCLPPPHIRLGRPMPTNGTQEKWSPIFFVRTCAERYINNKVVAFQRVVWWIGNVDEKKTLFVPLKDKLLSADLIMLAFMRAQSFRLFVLS